MWMLDSRPIRTTPDLVAAQESIIDKKKHMGRALSPSSSFSKYANSRHETLAPREVLT